MIKIEKALWIAVGILIALQGFIIPGVAFFLVLSFGALAFLYLSALPAILLNVSPIEYLKNKRKYDGEFGKKRWVIKVISYALAIAIIGTQFKLQFWPGFQFMLKIGVMGLAAIAVYLQLKERELPHIKAIQTRVIPILIGSALFYSLSVKQLIQYTLKGDTKELVNAYENLEQHPKDTTAIKRVQLAWEQWHLQQENRP